jgi:hypothetical protein
VIAFIVALALFGWTTLRTNNFSEELRDGLVASCKQNGNPLREYLREEAKAEIAEAKSFDYEEFFPNVPPERLHALIAQEIADAREALSTTLAPLDCDGLYPR